MGDNLSNILINENISIENNLIDSLIVNILEENDELPIITDNINFDNIIKFDFKNLLKFEKDSTYESFNKNLSDLNNGKNDFLGKKRNRIKEKLNIDENNENININEDELEKCLILKKDIFEK